MRSGSSDFLFSSPPRHGPPSTPSIDNLPASGEMIGDSFVDENGNQWVWDGEEYVVHDEEGYDWIFDGEDWVAKGDNGQHWLFDGVDWLLKADDGNFYVVDERGEFVLKHAPQTVTPQVQQPQFTQQTLLPTPQVPEPARRKERRKHRKRSKSKVGADRDVITINAMLPKQTSMAQQSTGFVPPPARPVEVLRVAPSVAHQCCQPQAHGCCAARQCSVPAPDSRPGLFSRIFGEGKQTQPQQVGVIHHHNGFPTMLPLVDAIQLEKAKRGQKFIDKPAKNAVTLLSSTRTPDGHEQRLEWRPVAPSQRTTADSGGAPIIDPHIEMVEDNPGDKYRNLAAALADCKAKGTGRGIRGYASKRPQDDKALEAKRRQLQQVTQLIEKISRSGTPTTADALVLTMAKTMGTLLNDAIK